MSPIYNHIGEGYTDHYKSTFYQELAFSLFSFSTKVLGKLNVDYLYLGPCSFDSVLHCIKVWVEGKTEH